MARNLEPKGKIVRRFGVNIFDSPKYDRLLQAHPTAPGQHGGKRRSKPSEYGKRLVEKQKLRLSYGLSERQFRHLFVKAKSMKGVTGHNMLTLLERRLDNVVYRLRMASTRAQARQLISHGHIMVNQRKATIPSVVVTDSMTISVKAQSATREFIGRLMKEKQQRAVPSWLILDEQTLVGRVSRLPDRSEIPTIADEQLVVEFYSK